ncbi:hypothetical protein [Flavobacterium sp.]|jgi:hypothetical protein|uniref:hypothetical protein n=1 Tax=Flavobacterium sp. TaxID=239 RepID=UPI0037BFABC3
MSTTFGISRLKQDIDLVDDCLTEQWKDDDFIEVAFRGNGTGIRWTNDLVEFLPDNLKVYPLDNSAQGIYSIGDIREEIFRQNLVGQTLISARKELKDRDYRIVKIDGQDIYVTDDIYYDRLNLEIENGIITNVYEG